MAEATKLVNNVDASNPTLSLKIQIERKVLQLEPKQYLSRQTRYKTNHFIRGMPTNLTTITRICKNIITHMLLLLIPSYVLLLLILFSTKKESVLFVGSQDIFLLNRGTKLREMTILLSLK